MSELTRIDLLLLGLLMDRPMHGYELHQTIQEEEVDSWFNLSLPGIYYSLGKLRDRDLVVEMQSTRSTGSSRAVYRVTESGREAFFTSLETEAVNTARPHLEDSLRLQKKGQTAQEQIFLDDTSFAEVKGGQLILRENGQLSRVDSRNNFNAPCCHALPPQAADLLGFHTGAMILLGHDPTRRPLSFDRGI